MKKTIVSTSKKRRSEPSANGVRYKTQMVITKIPIGKNKNGKEIYRSVTRHENVY